MALMAANTGMQYFILRVILLIWWEYADLALGKAFEILSHGDMLYLSTDDKGHVDDGTVIRIQSFRVLTTTLIYTEISAHEIIQHMNQTLHSEDRSTRLSSLMTIFASLNFGEPLVYDMHVM